MCDKRPHGSVLSHCVFSLKARRHNWRVFDSTQAPQVSNWPENARAQQEIGTALFVYTLNMRTRMASFERDALVRRALHGCTIERIHRKCGTADLADLPLSWTGQN
jgi:hypothetical protein